MRIKTLLKKVNVRVDSILFNHEINDITDISKNVLLGDVFVAIKGVNFDGHDFLEQAIDNGCKTIIHEEDVSYQNSNINFVKVASTKKIYAALLDAFYEKIKKDIIKVGITGTNGKTSTSNILSSFLEYMGHKCCLIGTNGIFIGGRVIKINNTTPSIRIIYDMFKEMYEMKIKYLVMEITSVAVKELRVDKIMFDAILFTNFASDHLDYHKTKEDYFYSKARLLNCIKEDGILILNSDDEKYRELLFMSNTKVNTYAINHKSDFRAVNIKIKDDTWTFDVNIDSTIYHFETQLIGMFNILNILSVLCFIYESHISIESFIEFLRIFTKLEGRMEVIRYKTNMYVIDYAHTESSVKNCLETLKYYNQDIILVIGCGGNRDTTKRAKIGEVSCKNATHVIFTSDNPRDEDPQDIINDITKDLKYSNYEIEIDRLEAIKKAVRMSKKNDIIAILGKGCEEYVIKNNTYYPFNDKLVLIDSLRGDEIDSV